MVPLDSQLKTCSQIRQHGVAFKNELGSPWHFKTKELAILPISSNCASEGTWPNTGLLQTLEYGFKPSLS